MTRFSIKKLGSWLKGGRHHPGQRWREVYSLFDEGRFSEAYEIFSDVVRDRPALLENGDMCVLFAELELFANNNCGKAQELLARAERQGFSAEVVFYRVRGMARCMSEHYDEIAVRDLEECVALDPCPRHLALLAQCFPSWATAVPRGHGIAFWRKTPATAWRTSSWVSRP